MDKTLSLAGAAPADPVPRTGFGAAGWRMILFSVLMYFAYAGWCVDGINIFAPALAAKNGWSTGQLLTLVTPGALFGVVGSAVFGQVLIKKGPRWVMSFCAACTAVAVFWFGRITTLWEFTAVFIVMNFFAAGFGFIAPGALMNYWFPRRKGMALAIATSGYPLATALFVPLIAVMFNTVGIGASTAIWAGIFLLLAVAAWLVIRDTPEEIGCFPDNDPRVDRARLDEMAGYVSPLTVRRLLKDRDMWLISVGWGCLWMVTVGIVVQLIPRLMELGYDEPQALGFLSGAALCALPGGLLWGWLDQKFGTKTASALYGAMYIVTLVLLVTQSHSPVMTFLTIVLVGVGLGGIKNLITSMVGSVYGRYDFTAAYRIVIPLAIIVRTLCFPIMGLCMQQFQTLSAAYLVFIGVDVLAVVLVLLTTSRCKGKTLG
ncbi:MFS transporter [Rubrivivax gelatinosus]|uniref:Major facilitator superfamily MFS_1 n=1 Tax=Rubrivivax gelatinosus (strain NBRC 100245 / IL144) TaxID=983917 RepID=I0HKF7_RUBGI|nr:MFS transporter [Rubrivivax gelatinosus]BAL93494.1 major facilitator superfamily MFS_1 [Rubrivivax gelatinosus IL144]